MFDDVIHARPNHRLVFIRRIPMVGTNYGTLKTWREDCKYGFVRDDASGKDLFVHVSGFADKVAAPLGSRLKYHLAPNPRKSGHLMVVDAEIILRRVIAAQYSDNSGVL
jgi:cold shock CspA family protein